MCEGVGLKGLDDWDTLSDEFRDGVNNYHWDLGQALLSRVEFQLGRALTVDERKIAEYVFVDAWYMGYES